MSNKVSHQLSVRQYFDSVASGYHRASVGKIWGSLRRLEAAAVRRSLGSLQGAEVIELGCGTGFYTELLFDMGARHVVAVDLSPDMLRYLRADRVTAIVADVATFAPDRPFEVLLAAGVLEFVSDPEAVLRNAARFALSGGRLVILYPKANLFGFAYRLFHSRHGFHINLFLRATVHRMAEAAGWRVDSIVRCGPFSDCARLIRS